MDIHNAPGALQNGRACCCNKFAHAATVLSVVMKTATFDYPDSQLILRAGKKCETLKFNIAIQFVAT
jgi:hypothetical protein